jgi:hypothetical protein
MMFGYIKVEGKVAKVAMGGWLVGWLVGSADAGSGDLASFPFVWYVESFQSCNSTALIDCSQCSRQLSLESFNHRPAHKIHDGNTHHEWGLATGYRGLWSHARQVPSTSVDHEETRRKINT